MEVLKVQEQDRDENTRTLSYYRKTGVKKDRSKERLEVYSCCLTMQQRLSIPPVFFYHDLSVAGWSYCVFILALLTFCTSLQAHPHLKLNSPKKLPLLQP